MHWQTKDHEVLVVLGGGFLDSNRLSRSSIERTKIAMQLYQERPCPILFSGGPTWQPSSLSEAQAMANFAQDAGVEKSHLHVEGTSMNTWENARFSVPILRAHGFQRVLLITSPHHLYRARICFKIFGLNVIPYPGPFPKQSFSIKATFTEYGALLKTLKLWLEKKI